MSALAREAAMSRVVVEVSGAMSDVTATAVEMETRTAILVGTVGTLGRARKADRARSRRAGVKRTVWQWKLARSVLRPPTKLLPFLFSLLQFLLWFTYSGLSQGVCDDTILRKSEGSTNQIEIFCFILYYSHGILMSP